MTTPVAPQQRTASDMAISLIRTWVPIGVGAVLAWGADSQHIVLPAGASATAGTFAAAACAAAYYALARTLEHQNGAGLVARAARLVGRFMLGGVVRTPVYPQPAPPAAPGA